MPDRGVKCIKNVRKTILILISCVLIFLVAACSGQKTEYIKSVSDLNKTGYIIGVPEGTPPEEVAAPCAAHT